VLEDHLCEAFERDSGDTDPEHVGDLFFGDLSHLGNAVRELINQADSAGTRSTVEADCEGDELAGLDFVSVLRDLLVITQKRGVTTFGSISCTNLRVQGVSISNINNKIHSISEFLQDHIARSEVAMLASIHQVTLLFGHSDMRVRRNATNIITKLIMALDGATLNLANEHVTVKYFNVLGTSMGVIEDAWGGQRGKGVAKAVEDRNLKWKGLHFVSANKTKGGAKELATAFDSTIGKTGKIWDVTIV
jgi:hypothetical protein